MLASGDTRVPPLIDPNFLGGTRDLDALVGGVQLSRRVLAAPSLALFAARDL